MLWVPAGSFAFGDTVYREETPVRQATVQGFWMDRTEVTNAEFARFVQATGYVTTAERPVDARLHPGLPPAMQQPGAVVFVNPTELRNGGDPRQWWLYLPGANWRHPSGPGSSLAGRDAYPVVAVTLADAQAYARWAGRSLPTEREWEWAAGGGQTATLPTTPPTTPGTAPAQPAQANTWQGFFPLANQASDGLTNPPSPPGRLGPLARRADMSSKAALTCAHPTTACATGPVPAKPKKTTWPPATWAFAPCCVRPDPERAP